MDRGGRFVRPVNQERKSIKARGKAGRAPARGIARPAQPPYGRRSGVRNDLLSRFFRFLRRLLEARRPVLWLTLATVALTGIAVLFAGGFVGRTVHRTDSAAGALVSGAGFGVAQVHLAGNLHTSADAVMAALGFRHGQAIFDVDLRAARARLLQLPWVADAEVKRRYPDDISVRIVERVPYARWHSSNGLYVVERNGRPITGEGADSFLRLPLLVGEGAPAAAEPFVEAVERRRAIAARVEAYQLQSGRRWNLLLNGEVTVKLPETGWQKQLADLERLIVDKHILDADIREIDLRSPTHYFFVRRTIGADKDKKAGSSI
jgi:cell division protein FtsQ